MDKKLLVSVGLSIMTVWGFQYYFGSKQQAPVQQGVVSVSDGVNLGKPIKVIATEDLYKPLNFSIDFVEEKVSEPETVTVIENDFVVASFSSYGGVLKSLDFKEHRGKSGNPLRTVYGQGSFDADQRKKGCFLLAFEEKTPFFYKMLSRNVEQDRELVTYQTTYGQWLVNKTYTIYTESYKVDLSISFEPKSNNVSPLKPRLIFVAPFVHEIEDDALKPFLANESSGKVEVKEVSEVSGFAWYWTQSKPLFGAEDKYFVHGLIADDAHFTQRAFYKCLDERNVYPILEGKEISEKSDWTMSFYMGPKLYDHMFYLDSRLSDLLNFGWLSWFCKLILKLLKYINDYVGNYGLAIIFLAIILRLPFLPLSLYSRRMMTQYQHHQPAINHIRKKFKNNASMLQQEIMKYHQEHNISPATPVLSCFPLLIQLPVIFSLYRVLGNYLDLYQAPFFGWIVDLSAKDPYYVLPVLMGTSMAWQQSIMPVGDEKQRVVMFFMAIVMSIVFASFPAGLVLYWSINNLLTIGEEYLRKALFGK